MPVGNSALAGIDPGSPAEKSNLLTTVPLSFILSSLVARQPIRNYNLTTMLSESNHKRTCLVMWANGFKKDETEKKLHVSSHYLLDDPRSIQYNLGLYLSMVFNVKITEQLLSYYSRLSGTQYLM